MLSDQAWNRIRAYTSQVVNREADDVIFEEGSVHRDADGGVTIKLLPISYSKDEFIFGLLEPEDEPGT